MFYLPNKPPNVRTAIQMFGANPVAAIPTHAITPPTRDITRAEYESLSHPDSGATIEKIIIH